MCAMLSGLFIRGDNGWVVLANKTISVSLSGKTDHGSMRFGHIRDNVQAVRPNRLPQFRFSSHHFEFLVDTKASFQTLLRLIYQRN